MMHTIKCGYLISHSTMLLDGSKNITIYPGMSLSVKPCQLSEI